MSDNRVRVVEAGACLVSLLLSPSQIGPAMTRMSAASTRPMRRRPTRRLAGGSAAGI